MGEPLDLEDSDDDSSSLLPEVITNMTKELRRDDGSDETRSIFKAYRKHRMSLERYEQELWQSYGLPPDDIDPDELLVECRKTWKGESQRKKVEESLHILDCLHRGRKIQALNNKTGYYPRAWEILERVAPCEPLLSLGPHFWALIIGNNDYPPQRRGAHLIDRSLQGCINDALLVKRYLGEYLHVPEHHIMLIEDAHRSQITDALYDLRDNEKIKFGDNILIHYSGHGSSYNPKNYFMEEPWQAGSIEAICPVDRGWGARDISERELNSILSEVHAAKGPNITVIFDCCHSGGALRSLEAFDKSPTLRYISAQEDDDALYHMIKLGMDHPRRRSKIDFDSENWEADTTSFVQLAGCRSFELGMEMDVNVFGLGRQTNGLFTHALVKVLESQKGRRVTYEGVIQTIGCLREFQTPVAVGTRKNSLLWFRDATQ